MTKGDERTATFTTVCTRCPCVPQPSIRSFMLSCSSRISIIFRQTCAVRCGLFPLVRYYTCYLDLDISLSMLRISHIYNNYILKYYYYHYSDYYYCRCRYDTDGIYDYLKIPSNL